MCLIHFDQNLPPFHSAPIIPQVSLPTLCVLKNRKENSLSLVSDASMCMSVRYILECENPFRGHIPEENLTLTLLGAIVNSCSSMDETSWAHLSILGILFGFLLYGVCRHSHCNLMGIMALSSLSNIVHYFLLPAIPIFLPLSTNAEKSK